MTGEPNAVLAAALEHATRDWRVFPLAHRRKVPVRGSHGWHDASNDPGVLRGWFASRPGLNLGLACEPSGLLALDFDPRNGEEALHEAERDLGPLPPCPRSLTGSGGVHLLFDHPGIPVRGQVHDGLEVKSEGYIVLPPSVHPNGRSYQWEVTPDEVELPS
ncbi:MAG: bifunctional DNA primase/polymerase, partial [Solirubrobacteraceae bacterium]